MAQIIDLSMPIADHLRWPVDRSVKRSEEFQITRLGWAVHGFTHIDAPRHMVPGGPTTTDLSLDRTVGRAAVVDLTGVDPESEISEARVREAGDHIEPDGIVLLKTCWDTVESVQTPEFWTRAPYLSRSACEWLLSRQIKAIGFDFPQDYPIRLLLKDERAPISDFVSHDVLLRNNVNLMEYLCNMKNLTTPYTQLYALPLKILDADGAPARIIAIQD